MPSGTQKDVIGRIIGMLVFLGGVAALGLVFSIAYKLFNAPPETALGLTFKNNPKTDPTAAAIGAQFGVLLFRLAYLFIMSIAGSLIANKGINLYFSALQGSPVNLLHRHNAAPAPEPPVQTLPAP